VVVVVVVLVLVLVPVLALLAFGLRDAPPPWRTRSQEQSAPDATSPPASSKPVRRSPVRRSRVRRSRVRRSRVRPSRVRRSPVRRSRVQRVTAEQGHAAQGPTHVDQGRTVLGADGPPGISRETTTRPAADPEEVSPNAAERTAALRRPDPKTMNVEIWSDIACPWCYVGKRRFEAALRQFEHADEVTVTWRSFELDPGAPLEREGEGAAHVAQKYGMTLEQARASQDQLAAIAAGEGIEMRFDIQRQGLTFDGHRVIHLAAERGRQDAMKERLMRAYFTEGALVSDHETLVSLAREIGLDSAEVRATLDGDRFADEVREDELTAQRFGISAIPTFVVDRALGASGAQPPEQLLALLRDGHRASAAAVVTTPTA
jgi:predicted DsbA family dithiol-disulfide isomerase